MSDPLPQTGSNTSTLAESRFQNDLAAAQGIIGNAREPLAAQSDFVETLQAENSMLARLDIRNRLVYEENMERFAEAANALRTPDAQNVAVARALLNDAAMLYFSRNRQRSKDARACAASMPEPSTTGRRTMLLSVERSP